LTYLFAFWSLKDQVLGLFGSEGIVPFQWDLSDNRLKWATYAGIIFSLIALSGYFVPGALFFAWLLYLLFYLGGYPFLSFQWDALLVEVGFIAVFYSFSSPPPLLIHIALWVVLFKLMLSSGLVKWLSGCPEWRLLRALNYHFETQPLPNRGGFFAHQVVKHCTKLVAGLVFILETFVPILYFGTPTMRITGAILTILFQIVIIATGNYAFFNLLTIALCVTLFEMPPLQTDVLSLALNGVGAILIGYNILLMVKQFIIPRLPILGMRHLRGLLNTYGLFAVMTTVRDEIIIEGSEDGIIWKEYRFKYKPGLADEGVKQIAPFQPRLDWQMWFAALSDIRNSPWFQSLAIRLLQGSKPVLSLFKENPFPEKPPKYLRAMRYRFHFNTLAEQRQSGAFWKKECVGIFMPQIKI
jgi:hypothetical protein